MSSVPLRILLDTNVYGLIAKQTDPIAFVSLVKNRSFVVCGSMVIRQELRDISKKAMLGKSRLRSALLATYDSLVDEKRNYSLTELVKTVAREYNNCYCGSFSWKELENDFLIVATASLHNIDIVISNDEKTMTSYSALASYRLVNEQFELQTPRFRKFGDFELLL